MIDLVTISNCWESIQKEFTYPTFHDVVSGVYCLLSSIFSLS